MVLALKFENEGNRRTALITNTPTHPPVTLAPSTLVGLVLSLNPEEICKRHKEIGYLAFSGSLIPRTSAASFLFFIR